MRQNHNLTAAMLDNYFHGLWIWGEEQEVLIVEAQARTKRLDEIKERIAQVISTPCFFDKGYRCDITISCSGCSVYKNTSPFHLGCEIIDDMD